jgi:transposase InsO family protein
MIITDASDAAYAGILLQPAGSAPDTERHWHPVAYHSKSFVGPQVRYMTYDKELMAISECFKTWRHFVEGASHPVRVLSDHDNLKYFMTTQTLSGRQARIAEYLAAFDFTIEYKKGTANPSDGLSRRPDYFAGFKDAVKRVQLEGMLPTLQEKLRAIRLDDDAGSSAEAQQTQSTGCGDSVNDDSQTINYEQSDQLLAAALDTGPDPGEEPERTAPGTHAEAARLAPVAHFAGTADGKLLVPRLAVAAAAVDETAYVDPPEDIVSLIREVQARDAFVQDIRRKDAIRAAAGSDTAMAREESAQYAFDSDGLLRHQGRVYVPRSSAVRQELLRRNHDDPVAGHYGRQRTQEILTRKYSWPHLSSDVRTYVEECDVCQRTKPKHHKPYGELQPLQVPSQPWKSLSMDFITGLPDSKGFNGRVYDSVLVVVDRFSKMARYFPVTKTIDAPQLADLLYNKVVMFTGPPDSIVSDRGSVFTSEYWSAFCYHLAVKKKLSTAFHPQTDGQTERQNQQLESHLRIYCNYDQDDWARLLYTAAFAYNSKVHASHGRTPIELATGTRPSIPDGIRDEFPTEGERRAPGKLAETATTWLLERQNEFDVAKRSLEKAAQLQAKYHNRHTEAKHFGVGEQVLLSGKNIHSKRPHKKLDNKWLGPFRILERISKQAYKLNLPPSMKRLHPTFHVSLLEPYKPRPGYQPPPVDDLEDDVEGQGPLWEVERVVSHRIVRGKRLYRTRWLGYSPEEDWELYSEDLSGAEEVLSRYCQEANVDRASAAPAPDAGRTPRTQSQPYLPTQQPKRKRGRPRKKT